MDTLEIRTDPYITDASPAIEISEIKYFHSYTSNEYDGDNITVAVMDSGVDDTHSVFDGVDVEKHNFTDATGSDAVGHGTGCAGLIAQIAPGVDIISLRIFGNKGSTGWGPIKEAYEWLYDNADEIDIVNMSWGASGKSRIIDEHHNKLVNEGIIDSVAAGNTASKGGSPATAREAFSVGAVAIEGEVTRFSSYNPEWENPDVSALGKNIKLPRADGTSMGSVIDADWVKASGTSFSAPISAGFMARYVHQFDGSPDNRFENTARNIKNIPRDGHGILDYAEAIEEEGRIIEETDAEAWPFSKGDVVYIDADWFEWDSYEANLMEDNDGDITVEFLRK